MNLNPYLPPLVDPRLRAEPPVLAHLVGGEGLAVEYTLVSHDVVQFALYHHRTSPASRWRVYRALGIFSVMFLVLFLLVARQAMQTPELWAAVVLVAVVGLAFLVTYPFIYRWQLKLMATRMYAEGKNLVLFGHVRLSISPEFLNHATPYSQSLIRWIAVEKVTASKDAGYLYVTAATAHVVPRRAFASDSDFQTFVRTAQDFHARAQAAENPLRMSV